MKYMPMERLWERFSNKYEAVILGAWEVRRVIEAIRDGKIEINEDPYLYAIKHLLTAKSPEKKTAKKKATDAAQES